MSDHTPKTSGAATPVTDDQLQASQPGRSLKERFQDRRRWKKSLYDVTLWFLFGVLVTTMLSQFSPGYPILVGTASVQKGLYWVDRQATRYEVGDYITFPFKPSQPWLQERYGSDRIYTKQVKAVAGDTVYADDQGELRVCWARVTPSQPACETLGRARTVDRKGRPMTPWLAAEQAYTLQAGEVWAHGPNPLSLDSRYYGPVSLAIVSGRAKPLLRWGE